ncbi:MAG: GreA/GreB family elongation factor [Burkholderiaceae bacterium]|nr:GreA/GreB family elongation factor [Burkholderiaceae bacterium]
MLRWVALLLVVLLVALQVQLWTGHGGLRDLWRLQQNITAQKQDNAALRKRNDTLAAEVEDLASGARHTLVVCYPADAEPAKGYISVLSPVGLALLGLPVGAVARWQAPSGDEKAAKVAAILFQPEASGDYVT